MRFFYYATPRNSSLPAAAYNRNAAAGRNRLGKFPATVIQTRVVRRKNTVPYSAAVPLPHEVNVCISIILRSDECREPTTLTATLPFSLLALKAPTVFFRRYFVDGISGTLAR